MFFVFSIFPISFTQRKKRCIRLMRKQIDLTIFLWMFHVLYRLTFFSIFSFKREPLFLLEVNQGFFD